MSALKIDHGAWIVVCDGRKALIIENVGDARLPDLRTKQIREHATPSTSSLGADAPGRVHQSVGEARSSVEQTDWHDRTEQVFLRELAEDLHAAVARKHTAAIIVVAPPRALGALRQRYSAELREAVRAEVDKDLVNLPIDEIERHVIGQAGLLREFWQPGKRKRRRESLS